MEQISFIITKAGEGGYCAEAVDVGIFAEGETMDELKSSIKSGIDCYYADGIIRPFSLIY